MSCCSLTCALARRVPSAAPHCRSGVAHGPHQRGVPGVLLGGVFGCLIFPLVDRLLPLRLLYPEPKDRVVVIPFAPIETGQTLRLRIEETYTAPASYRLEGEELEFDRSLGRPRNAVMLPSGWYCTFSAVPATVDRLPDGTVLLHYWDDRPEALNVLLKARRRVL